MPSTRDLAGGGERTLTAKEKALFARQAVASPAAVARAAGAGKRVAVVLLGFANTGPNPFTAQQVHDAYFGRSFSVAAAYRSSSYGQMEITGEVLGPYQSQSSTVGCNWRDWQQTGFSLAAANGVDLNQFDIKVFVVPHIRACDWAGLGTDGLNWINGYNEVGVYVHELGHALTLNHSASYVCSEGGYRVSLAANCSTDEYGDLFSPMGDPIGFGLTGYHRAALGYLRDTQTVSSSGVYSLAPVEALAPQAPRLLRIARGDGTYLFLDYRDVRTAAGLDSRLVFAADNGVAIRVGDDISSVWGRSFLLDGAPSTSSMVDAPFIPGTALADPVGNLRVVILSVTPTITRVAVTLGSAAPADTVAPSAPAVSANRSSSSVTLTMSGASDNVGVAGYQVFRNGLYVGSASDSSYIDSAIDARYSYEYAVRAFDSDGNLSAFVKAVVGKSGATTTTPTTPNTKPNTPTTRPNTPPTTRQRPAKRISWWAHRNGRFRR